MWHKIYEDDDGNMIQEFDEEAIDYFIQGLEELRASLPGEQFSTPNIHTDEKGTPVAVSKSILLRVEDVDAP